MTIMRIMMLSMGKIDGKHVQNCLRQLGIDIDIIF